jgi:lipopolysaccharide biosynthesis regulator YciM
MSVRWFAILVLLLALFVAYLAILNPTPVLVKLPFMGALNPTSGSLMMISFAVGIIATLVFFAVRDWQEYFRKLAEEKRRRQTETARNRIRRARTFLQVGLEEAALGVARDTAARVADMSEAHEFLGDILSRRGDYYGAAASHSQAMALDIANDTLIWKLAEDYLKAGNGVMAHKVLKDGLVAHEKSPYLLSRHRDLLMLEKDWTGAIALQNRLGRIKEYRSSDDFKRTMAGLHLEKGKSLLADGKADEAAREFEETVKLEQTMSIAYIRTAEAFLAQSKDKSALKMLALGYRRTGDAAILSRLEEYYLTHDDPSRIINMYLRHLEEKPEDVDLRLQLAALFLKLEMREEAQTQIEEVRRIKGEDSPRVALLAYRLKMKSGDQAGALNELVYLAEHHPAASSIYSCAACETETDQPGDRCLACGRWGTLRIVP